MINYLNLLNEGKIKKGRFSAKQVQNCLKIAQRDIKTTQTILETSPEWAFNIAYNAMQQAARSFMFYHGYRSAGLGHHATTIRFLEIGLSNEHEELLTFMERMRRMRNHATYDEIDTISHIQAEEAIDAAKEIVKVIIKQVR